MNGYRELVVWQKAMDVVELVYGLVKKLPKEEQFALATQMRRSAISIPSNIAEGNARFSAKEYIHFLSIAHGSKAELETQLLLCVRLKYATEADIVPIEAMLETIGRMLGSLIKKLNQSVD